MSLIVRALLQAFATLLHPRMWLLMVLPVAAALTIWVLLAIAFWAPAIDWLEPRLRDWNALQWLLDYWPLTLIAAHAVWVLLVALSVPLVIITTILIVGVFAMPIMVSHVSSRQYAMLEMRRGGNWVDSVWNGVVAILWFVLAAAISFPLWFFPPLWPVVSLGLLGYLNQRVFRYDALSLHGSADEIREIVRSERWPLLVLGVLVAIAAHVPLLGFFAPVYGGLVFVHYLLDRLQRMRDVPLDETWPRLENRKYG